MKEYYSVDGPFGGEIGFFRDDFGGSDDPDSD